MPKRTTELTPKEQRFVEEYPVDLNATDAIARAGFKFKSYGAQREYACTLLAKPNVQKAISERLEEKGFLAEIETFRTIREAKRLAFFDPRKLFNSDGSPKDIQQLDDETAACIGGLEVMEIWEGKGEDRKFVGYLKKYKISDKNSALDKLFRYMALYKDPGSKDNPVEHRVTIVYEKLHTQN